MYFSALAKNSLRTQIALLFGSLVAGTVLLVALGFGEWIERDARREAAADVLRLGQTVAAALANGIEERRVLVGVIADADEVWREGLASPQAQALVRRAQLRQHRTVWVGVARPDGQIITATDNLLVGRNVAEQAWFQKGLESPFVDDAEHAPLLPMGVLGGTARHLEFSAPVRVNGQVVAVLGLASSWDWVRDVVDTLAPQGAESSGLDVLVFDGAGQLIHAPPGRLQVMRQREQRLPAFDPRGGATQVIDWTDGTRSLSARVPMPQRAGAANLGWQVVAREPVDQAFARSNGAVHQAMLVGLAAAVLAAFISWRLARRLSTDLQTLARAARHLRTGTQATEVPLLGSSREVHELSRAMALMAEHLLHAHAEMEAQVRQRTEELEHANQELDRQARTDPLTGLLNRRGFDAQIGYALALAARNLQPLSVVVFDIDHFKRVNDTYGHPVGDLVLQRLARHLQTHVRASDIVARIGGEEFVALLPHTDTSGAQAVAQNVLDAVAATPDPDAGRITVSAGVSSLRNLQDTATELLQRADEALYEAKETGRNRVCVRR